MVDVDWDAAAPAWDRHRDTIEDMKAEFTERLVSALGPLAGRRILELGAGTGELAARLAALAGPTGSVLATDLNEGMVALLEKRLAAVPNAEVATVDAGSIQLSPASFDAVVFRMGLMMAPDPERAAQGIRRVLAPGGVFATLVWGTPQENPWMVTVGMAAAMSGLVSGGPPLGPGGPFSLSDPAGLEAHVRAGGFDDVTVTKVVSRRTYRDAAEQVREIGTMSPQLAGAFAAATPAQVQAVTEQVEALTAQYRDGDVLELPTTALLCVAR